MSKSLTKLHGRPITHGIRFWLRHGKINPSIRGYKKLQKFLEDLEKQLLEEQGGAANLTAARELLIRCTIRGLGVILLTELYISKYSVIRPDMAKRGVLQYQPIIERSYWAAQAQIRNNLALLGLERRQASEALDLGRYIAEFDEKKAAQAASKGKAADSDSQAHVEDGGQAQDEGPGSGPSRDGEGQGDGDE
jgi:hypothetical protein